MKPLSSYFILSLLIIFIITGCAQWGGDNPLSITGGSGEGYGQNDDLILPENSGNIDPALVGMWSYLGSNIDIMFTFYTDGTFRVQEYSNDHWRESMAGTWSVSGKTLTFNENGKSSACLYSIHGTQLTLNYGEYVLVLLRTVGNI